MTELQVLLATMDQKDASIADKMNIRCAAVIANQADREEIRTEESPFGPRKLISTRTRGVGLNRNIALLAAEGEYLLLADDDVVYNDDMPQQVVAAFRDNPRADVLIFSMDMVKNGVVTEKRHLPNKRRRIWNAMRFGTYTMAIRREALIRGNITFHQSFGGGCPFSAGEDTLFLKACFDAGLRVYSHSYVLGTCCKDTSSWFVGYHEKYFYDKGVLVKHLFPKTAWIMGLYFGARFKRQTDVPMLRRISLVYRGIRNGQEMIPYGR